VGIAGEDKFYPWIPFLEVGLVSVPMGFWSLTLCGREAKIEIGNVGTMVRS
jgi:hypothetical protein